MRTSLIALVVVLCLILAPASVWTRTQSDADYDHEFIAYSKTRSTDAIARLQERIDQGREKKMTFDPIFGYLPDILQALRVPVSSQSLVFSKTSFQFTQIHPNRPRALYFNDDVYVGYVQGSRTLEFGAVDPKLGAVFYTLEEDENAQPQFHREVYACLLCHDSSATTSGVPGFMTLTVLPDPEGNAIRGAGSPPMTDHMPFNERWGGWYVTGSHGAMLHRGNTLVTPPKEPSRVDWSGGANMTSLPHRVDTARYLTPTSDIVALMLLTHQTRIHNLITRANYEGQRALKDEEAAYKGLARPGERYSGITAERLRGATEPLVRGMFFVYEAEMSAPVRGVSSFAQDFEKSGIRDSRGRSLKDLDLNRRLLRYPLSYLIYSEAFDALPEAVRNYFYERVSAILNGADETEAFRHLSPADREAIRQILTETKPDFRRRVKELE